MQVPSGFKASSPSKDCKLPKLLYGFKQGSQQWYVELSVALFDLVALMFQTLIPVYSLRQQNPLSCSSCTRG